MIKFFRKIRQRLLSAGKLSKYLLYAFGEIILVVVGILIALQINNWNQDRINRNQTKNILRQIKADLDLDMEILERGIKDADQVLEMLRDLEDITTHSIPDSISYILGRIHRITEWNPIVLGYNSYLEFGRDKKIPKELDEKISILYTRVLHETNETRAKDLSLFALNQYRNLLIKHGFPITHPKFETRAPKDSRSVLNLLEDPQFIGVIRNYQFGFAGQRWGYQEVIKAMEELGQSIDNYLTDN